MAVLQGGLPRQLFAPGVVHAAQWTATPAVATVAERWLGTTVTVQTPAQRALAVVDSAWDLRQFDLALFGHIGYTLSNAARSLALSRR